MNEQQRQVHRDVYNRLRAGALRPGESLRMDGLMYELTARDLRTWDEAMADPTPVPPPTKLFWLMLGKYSQPIARAA